ncbi:hypothetical protein ACFB49_27470 [Sphingomonas sp. DBB INV C78]|uniref:GGDEF domain-containing protein n=1 Tax=Sphingomonas sp. DBB INV C78 TaxID=3349434 RepID=UPI0036D410F3
MSWRRAIRELLATQEAIAGACDDADQVLQAVVAGASRIFTHARGALIEMRDGAELVYRAASGEMAEWVGFRLPLVGSLSGQAILSGEALVCADTEKDGRVDLEACRRLGIRSMVVVPLPFQTEQVGVLKIYSAEPDAFDEIDIAVSKLLVSPFAFGLASASQAAYARAHDQLALRFEATFHQAAVGIAHVAPEGRFLQVNDRFCEIAGHDRDKLMELGFQHITHPEDLDADLALLTSLVAGQIDHYSMEKRYIRRGGEIIWINLTVSLVRHGGEPDFFVAVIEDISKRKRAEQMAFVDMLTGLPNRRALLQDLARLFRTDVSDDVAVGVLFLDLDSFKQVNDRLGHAEGDRCLIAMAQALRRAARTFDRLYRMAGDEFVLVVEDATEEAVGELSRRLLEAVLEASTEGGWQVGLSTGAVLVAERSKVEVSAVLDAADRLMYRVKRRELAQPAVEWLDVDPAELSDVYFAMSPPSRRKSDALSLR